jgi:hypothetical protein
LRTILALAAALLLAPAAHAAHPSEVTIQSNVASPCTVTFDDPMLAIAWARVVSGEMPPEVYMQLYKAEMPGDPDAWLNAQHVVDLCMGSGA